MATTQDLLALGLPPLPEAGQAQSERTIETPTTRKAFKAAVRVMAKPELVGAGASKERQSLATVNAVCGLLKLYDASEIDRLLLECNSGERRFLLECLKSS